MTVEANQGGGMFGGGDPRMEGSPEEENQESGGGLFGGTKSNANPDISNTGGGGLFSGGGLFGSGTVKPKNPNYSKPKSRSGGLFNAAPIDFRDNEDQTRNTSRGLFERSPRNDEDSNSDQDKSNAGGGLFGGPSKKSSDAGTSGGLFSRAKGSSGGLFGNSNRDQNRSENPGLFSSNVNNEESEEANTGNKASIFGGGNDAGQTTATAIFGESDETEENTGSLFMGNEKVETKEKTGTSGSIFSAFIANNEDDEESEDQDEESEDQDEEEESGGGLFRRRGRADNTNTGGGLFGGGRANNTNTGGGMFGGGRADNANTGGGLFSSTGSGGLFGSSDRSTNNKISLRILKDFTGIVAYQCP